ncbi:hypothetical protein Mapa_013042 [Marchantia paleacea]|nr:hypothetical protein Mapa_013042 [Marchantia paleacea]
MDHMASSKVELLMGYIVQGRHRPPHPPHIKCMTADIPHTRTNSLCIFEHNWTRKPCQKKRDTVIYYRNAHE